MPFRSYDNLRVFGVVAGHGSFTSAAEELNLTKGAVSYQIRRLEEDLGFPVFTRQHRGVTLTDKGVTLWRVAQELMRSFEREIADLRDEVTSQITVGMTTYFASRWLSPRLMRFLAGYPGIGLRLQPLIDLINLSTQDIDMAIRWGKGDWTDMEIELLFLCPVFATVGEAGNEQINSVGLEEALSRIPLLHDRDGSDAWDDWHRIAALPIGEAPGNLVIPDPNVRVQAVIDGQGMALNDHLIDDELHAGRLCKVAETEMANYGYYLAYPKESLGNRGLRVFREWIMEESRHERERLCPS